MKTIIKALLAILCLLAVLMIACVVWYKASNRPDPLSGGPVFAEPAGDEQNASSPEAGAGKAGSGSAPLVKEDGKKLSFESLCRQCAAKTLEAGYLKYLPDKVLAELLFFDVENKVTEASACVWLDAGEYVAFKGRAYLMSGFAGEAVITYTLPEGRLLKVELSEDGADHDKWIEEHFTKDAVMSREGMLSRSSYDLKEDVGNRLAQKAEKALGVPVEKDNLLEIDRDTGKYKLIETIESGDTPDTYKFDTRVLEEGTLKK